VICWPQAEDSPECFPLAIAPSCKYVSFNLDFARKCERLCAVLGSHGDDQRNNRNLHGLTEHGDEASADKPFTLPYRDLHRLARRHLVRQGDVSIRATMLIHDDRDRERIGPLAWPGTLAA
jgi:hypothetical protein